MSRRLAATPLSPQTQARSRARKLAAQYPAAPPAIGNHRAVRSGAQITDATTIPSYEAVYERVKAVTDELPWIAAGDVFSVEDFAAELTIYRNCAAYFASRPPGSVTRQHKAQKVNVARLRVLNEMARDLGLTPAGRLKLGLTSARTDRELSKIRPVKSEERALAVAQILQASGVLPAVDAPVLEAEAEPGPPVQPPRPAEVIALKPVKEESA